MLRHALGHPTGAQAPSGNIYVKGAKTGSKFGSAGRRTLSISKVAARVGVGISVVDGVYAQYNQDRQRQDLSPDNKIRRATLRGAGAGVGAWAGASVGVFCGPAAVACGIAGGYLGAAAGGAIGGWVGRKFYGG